MSDVAHHSPRSPDHEQDLSGAHRWSDEEAEVQHLDPSSKGKARETYSNDQPQEYPPTTDDETETRQIEENLRRWELAERAKRKAARESVTADGSGSLLSNAVRRASILFSGGGGRPKRASDDLGRGTHAVLSSQENIDIVPLDDIAATPTPSPTHSEPSNPFSDAHAESLTPASTSTSTPTSPPKRPALLSASSSIRRPPSPKPLGLPPPRAPPPSLTPPPDPEPEPKESRWWHEWLCGLSEGPDRGGNNQSGRTNPFE
ncbi:hypothetical protein MIND_00050800 [Mycena indigotica]|uniref:Uncharacterized protein n=1 Tax=Mycena indigotica TaxID=2126181 RepID=A0A8H6WF12_9AGAR|nr:uncharacterized protein MIND_00050800 [Mycena indigotica]KAF7315362.1 hypothetical protein MIND_00050800 [Mycena indigotica]